MAAGATEAGAGDRDEIARLTKAEVVRLMDSFGLKTSAVQRRCMNERLLHIKRHISAAEWQRHLRKACGGTGAGPPQAAGDVGGRRGAGRPSNSKSPASKAGQGTEMYACPLCNKR